MFWRSRNLNARRNDPAVPASISTLRQLADREVIRPRNRYRRRAFWVRVFFRSSGVAVILASISLPFVAGSTFDSKDLVIASLGLLIAAVTGLRNFFQWDLVWRLMRTTEFQLTFKIAEWEAEFARLMAAPVATDAAAPVATDATEQAFKLTKRLISDARQIILAEGTQCFGTLSWPNAEARPRGQDRPGGPQVNNAQHGQQGGEV